MSAHTRQSDPPHSSTPYRIARIPAALRVQAAARLAGQPAERLAPSSQASGETAGRTEAGKRLLEAASLHGVDLSNLWSTLDPASDRVREACLIVPGAGRTSMVFNSPPRDDQAAAELSRLIDHACDQASGVTLAQALLDGDDPLAMRAYLDAGFSHVGDLMYMRRMWSMSRAIQRSTQDAWPDGVLVEQWTPGADEDIVAALERSYIDTLDCPSLCGLRDTWDVLDSHRSTGAFDPDLWWLVRLHAKPEGVLLLNPCPDQGHTELVYLGLSPALRGMGLGRRLLRMGIKALARRRERTIACAVDAANTPAVRLYESEGFTCFARRTALVRRAK